MQVLMYWNSEAMLVMEKLACQDEHCKRSFLMRGYSLLSDESS